LTLETCGERLYFYALKEWYALTKFVIFILIASFFRKKSNDLKEDVHFRNFPTPHSIFLYFLLSAVRHTLRIKDLDKLNLVKLVRF